MEKTRNKELKELQERISYRFKNVGLLNQALTHRSFVNENKSYNLQDNERLELLGDSVLDVIITHLLMDRFPEYTEGDLSKARAAVVNEKSLSSIAGEFKLGDYLLLGKGEEATNGRDKDSILAAAFEALVASIYLDGGFKKVFKVISKHFSSILAEEKKEGFYKDYKTQLQEYAQSNFKTTPQYILTSESGPDHSKTFQINALVNSIVLGKGTGRSKKAAEQEAAKEALQILLKNPQEESEGVFR
ncbi:MAG: ribonuclease III [Thermodesulfobacteriota bacterium]|nr:ribonuclease III [Thermodesulfobacteriota bacterium]